MAKRLRVGKFVGDTIRITPGTTRVKWTDGTISQIPVSGALNRSDMEVNGHTLDWKNKESNLPIQLFLLGMVIVCLLPVLEKEREKEAKEKRQAQLMREYSEMVNKLALLLGAGMTLQGAWRQITKNYSEEKIKKRGGERIVYEEMLIAQREIENGKGEIKAYEAFGERCELQKYRKLSSYLVQNLKKGNLFFGFACFRQSSILRKALSVFGRGAARLSLEEFAKIGHAVKV